MARGKAAAPKEIAVPVASKSMVKRISVQDAEARLVADAANISARVSQGGGNRVTLDNRAEMFNVADGMASGHLRIALIGFMAVNQYFKGAYDPKNLAAPVCFAHGEIIDEMAPIAESPEKQSDECRTCPMNVYGSHPTSANSKACKNTRLIAFKIVPEDGEDPDDKIYTFSVPPTGLKSFDNYIKMATRTYGHWMKSTVLMSAVSRTTYTSVEFSQPESNKAWVDSAALIDDVKDMLNRVPDFNRTPAVAAPVSEQVASKPRNPAVKR